MRFFLRAALILPILVTGCMPFNLQCSATIDWVDVIQFNGIQYMAQNPALGPALTDTNLGAEFARVKAKLSGQVCDPNRHVRDGDAAFLDPGTPVYAVKGYQPEFRLAARHDNHVVLYEVFSNPKARQGADLLDIGGKVRSIGINSNADGTTELAAITDPQQVTALVNMVLRAPTGKSSVPYNDNAYMVAFHLVDGTVVSRMYNLGSGDLGPGIVLPPAFGAAIKMALPR